MTNFEYIKEMKDWELAAWLCDIFYNLGCKSCPAKGLCSKETDGMTNWLGKEVEE